MERIFIEKRWNGSFLVIESKNKKNEKQTHEFAEIKHTEHSDSGWKDEFYDDTDWSPIKKFLDDQILEHNSKN